MKPATPEQFANCYGTFIADLVILQKAILTLDAWLRITLPELEIVYRLNKTLFSGYPATIKSLPRIVTKLPIENEARKEYGKNLKENQSLLNIAWTGATIDLKAALTCAEVDPSKMATILESFAKLKPILPSIKYAIK